MQRRQQLQAMMTKAGTPMPGVSPIAQGGGAGYPLVAAAFGGPASNYGQTPGGSSPYGGPYGETLGASIPSQGGVYALPGDAPQPYALPSQDWQATGVFPGGGYDANNPFASDPVARQNAQHILTDYAGENRENPNNQAESQALAEQNQAATGVYGYGSI